MVLQSLANGKYVEGFITMGKIMDTSNLSISVPILIERKKYSRSKLI